MSISYQPKRPIFVGAGAASRELGLSQAWLRAEAEAGRIPSIVCGRRRLFDPDQVRRALNEPAAEPAGRAAEGPAKHEPPLPLSAMARRLRVPQTWLRAECEAGRLPHLKAGSSLLFDAEAVETAIRQRLREQPAIAQGPTHV